MTAQLYGIKFCGKEGNKALVCGSVKGLEVGRKYCLRYWAGHGHDDHNLPNRSLPYSYLIGRNNDFSLTNAGCYLPGVPNGEYKILLQEVEATCEQVHFLVDSDWIDVIDPAVVQHEVYFSVRDDSNKPVANATITCGGKSGRTDSTGYALGKYDAGSTYSAKCSAPTGYKCTACSESFYLNAAKFIRFYVKKAVVDPCAGVECKPTCYGDDLYTTVCSGGDCVKGALVEKNNIATCGYVPDYDPKPECRDGDKKPGKVCVNGFWEDATCTEGTYTADRKKVCRGGVWVEVGEEPYIPEEPGDSKYLTVAEADERVRTGLACYIKCVLPILDLLPGIPYTPGAWVPPLCAITREP